MRYLIIIMLLIPSIARSDNSAMINATTVISTSILIIDYQQTRWMSKNWDVCQCFESNRNLGIRPSTERVDEYFAMLGIIHIAAQFLPDQLRLINNMYVIIEHGRAVSINYRNDIKF